jgi:hypothetical protein
MAWVYEAKVAAAMCVVVIHKRYWIANGVLGDVEKTFY